MCPPSTLNCTIGDRIDNKEVKCDGLCVNCATYIANPCIDCLSGYFCYLMGTSNAFCLACTTYPNFCADPYVYGHLPKSALNFTNIEYKLN
uniref:Uncharacterized protein n=1 Tax=Panagrolaimus sp. ES5 TaxID=591445 RepID=A0AC34GCE2_9BILA